MCDILRSHSCTVSVKAKPGWERAPRPASGAALPLHRAFPIPTDDAAASAEASKVNERKTPTHQSFMSTFTTGHERGHIQPCPKTTFDSATNPAQKASGSHSPGKTAGRRRDPSGQGNGIPQFTFPVAQPGTPAGRKALPSQSQARHDGNLCPSPGPAGQETSPPLHLGRPSGARTAVPGQ